MAQPRRQPVRVDLSPRAEKLGLLAGLTAGLAYSTFASFVANALTPVSGRLVAADSFHRVVSGHYQEVLSLDGALTTVVASLIVFVLVWWSTRVILEHWQREDWGRIGALDRSLSSGPMLIPDTVTPLASAVSKQNCILSKSQFSNRRMTNEWYNRQS